MNRLIPTIGILFLVPLSVSADEQAQAKHREGSSKVADDFNVANAVYKKPENIDSYIDASLTNAK